MVVNPLPSVTFLRAVHFAKAPVVLLAPPPVMEVSELGNSTASNAVHPEKAP